MKKELSFKGPFVFLSLVIIGIIIISLLLNPVGDFRDITGRAKGGPGGGTVTQCSDGIDNDGDGYCDFLWKRAKCNDGSIPGDTDCSSKDDDTESSPCVPSVEVCDNLDNDCDGLVDDGVTRQTTCGVGVCSGNSGIETCTTGTWGANTCDPFAGSSSEVCDWNDNDCDSRIDEDLTVVCNVASDCGVDGWVGNDYCGVDSNVYRNAKTYSCTNSGTCFSSCSSNTSAVLISVCNSGCLNGQCVAQQDSCIDSDGGNSPLTPGSVSGVTNGNSFLHNDYCVSVGSVQEYLCSGTSPTSVTENCGVDTWGQRYCSGAFVYQYYNDYLCSNGGCSFNQSSYFIESCPNGCNGGNCIGGNQTNST